MLLADTLSIAASGMRAQSERLQIVSENIANSGTTGLRPGDAPYRRKMVLFENYLDRNQGVNKVQVARKMYDMSDFPVQYAPSHPAANEEGYITVSNVNTMLEMVDMKEARRAYEANLNIIEVGRTMMQRTLDLLR